MKGKKYAAVVLSAGKGTRMNSSVPKQYLLLEGKPVLYYALQAFEESMVDEIVLVTGQDEIEYCQKEIVEKYGFTKVIAVTAGGAERYHSVLCGLTELNCLKNRPDYVMIHDGARPFINDEIISRCAQTAEKFQACAAGMPVKDTIKIADDSLFAKETPQRKYVWQIQTPQAFAFPLIYQAYEELMKREQKGEVFAVTDDAMVLETICGQKVKLTEGSYENIKITTPEDLKLVKAFFPKIR
ncbi:2-C-methyl-D-erythritol 4-phosphate cytidylyltransferase [Lachnospiraceae bacterium]|nr:2-C-methyl-D-erythritol 4-phosphate cytidylyltransferase [Lachnospiraceae bacterium]